MTEAKGEHPETETDPRPTPMRRVADSERQIVQAAALRRRQLRSALLYGSSRSWRQRLPLWPAALIGFVVVAVIMAAIAVSSAFQQEQERKREEEQQRKEQLGSLSHPATEEGDDSDWKLAG